MSRQKDELKKEVERMSSKKNIHSKTSSGYINNSATKLSRRSVLAAGLAAPWIVPRYVLGGPGYQTPSETLTIACIGVGGMGRNYLEGCKSERIVALCDLDHSSYPQI